MMRKAILIEGSLVGLRWWIVACAALGAVVGHGGEPAVESEAEEAAARGRAWLVAAQAADGSWGSGLFRESVAVTAQGVMAVVAGGSTPASGEHAAAVVRGVDFCLSCASADGLIAGREQAAHGPMYGHAYATLALAEVYGETARDEEIAAVLVRARDLIERTQNDEGGWRYQPRRADADASVTAAMLVALRGLHNCGFAVSADCVERAVAYLESLQNDDGGFRYLTAGGASGSPRTAAVLFALLAADKAGPFTDRGFAWLADHPVTLGSADGYAMYGLGHGAAAHWVRGTDSWARWYTSVEKPLLAAQQADGSWRDPSCPEYGTAAALTVLQMADGLSPLFGRLPRGEEVE
jgi:hypothetical protein